MFDNEQTNVKKKKKLVKQMKSLVPVLEEEKRKWLERIVVDQTWSINFFF